MNDTTQWFPWNFQTNPNLHCYTLWTRFKSGLCDQHATGCVTLSLPLPLVMILKDCRIARIACRRFFSFVFYPRHLQKGISSFSIFLSHCDMWSFKCHDKTWVFMTIRKHLQSSHNFIKWCRLRFVLFIRQRFLNQVYSCSPGDLGRRILGMQHPCKSKHLF